MRTIVQLILNATAAGKSWLLAADAAAQKALLSLTKSDVGLGNVDNTSDANKPVSTAQAAAIAAKIGGSVGATDNRLVRSDGTGTLTVQSTGITVDDSNNVSGVGTLSSGSITASGDITLTNAQRLFASNGTTNGNYLIAGNTVVFAANTVAQGGWNSSGMYARRLFLDYTNADVCLGRSSASVLGVFGADGTTPAGITAGAITASGALNLAPITKAALLLLTPNAATGGRWRVTDATPANREAYPDGTNWRYTSDDTVVT